MNNVEKDYLEVDMPIPGQNYVCLSFVSPEKFIKMRENYLFYNFALNLLNLEEQDKDKLKSINDVEEKYKTYLINNEEKLSDDYNKETTYVTNIRGLKVRGTYQTEDEANRRAERLQKMDKNHHVFVAQVGYWLPWDPDPMAIDNCNYADKELNDLMKNYKENEENKRVLFDQVKQQQIDAANSETQKKKLDLQDGNNELLSNNDENVLDKISEIRDIANNKDRMLSSLQEDDPWMKQKLEEPNNEEVSENINEAETNNNEENSDVVNNSVEVQNVNVNKISL